MRCISPVSSVPCSSIWLPFIAFSNAAHKMCVLYLNLPDLYLLLTCRFGFHLDLFFLLVGNKLKCTGTCVSFFWYDLFIVAESCVWLNKSTGLEPLIVRQLRGMLERFNRAMRLFLSSKNSGACLDELGGLACLSSSKCSRAWASWTWTYFFVCLLNKLKLFAFFIVFFNFVCGVQGWTSAYSIESVILQIAATLVKGKARVQFGATKVCHSCLCCCSGLGHWVNSLSSQLPYAEQLVCSSSPPPPPHPHPLPCYLPTNIWVFLTKKLHFCAQYFLFLFFAYIATLKQVPNWSYFYV